MYGGKEFLKSFIFSWQDHNIPTVNLERLYKVKNNDIAKYIWDVLGT